MKSALPIWMSRVAALVLLGCGHVAPKDDVPLIAFELVGISVLAGMIGVGLGYFMAAALLRDVDAPISGLYGQSVSGTLQFLPEWWVSGLLIAVGGTALAADNPLLPKP